VLGLSGAAWAQNTGKVYTADDGVEVVIVTTSDGKALVRVTGSGSELDGKVRQHDLEDGGRNRVDYRGRMKGRDYYTVRMRDGQYTVNLPKRDSVKLKYAEDKTKALKVDQLMNEFQKQTKDGTLANMERFDRKATQAAQEAALKEEVASLNKKCGTQVSMSVDWAAINDEALLKYSVSSFCGNPLGEAARLCESAEGKAFVTEKIKKASCTFKPTGPDMSLVIDGGTLKWTTSGEAYNQEEFARKELLGPAAADGQPVWGKLESLQQRQAMEKTALCTDGKSHYVALSPKQMYWGDGKQFVEVPSPGDMVGHEYFFDPRHVRAGSNPNFRGTDMRIHSRVDADLAKKTCSLSCGERTTQLQLVAAADAKKMLMDAKIGPSPQKHRPHRLLRDELGNYYYVDKGFRPGEEKRFRLFKGPKGSLKEQKMTNVVSDSEGEIFSTKTGSLRLIIDKKDPGVWLEQKKSLKLREVPIHENMPMIYNELGVYSGEKMGNPCDDL
jgi:hypothetical protein